MPIDFETGQNNLTKLIEWAKTNNADQKRNEAATRLHLIDCLLFECLGWGREECSPEESFENTYTDYSLGRAAKKCVWEAKKEGIHFELPAGLDKGVCNLKTLCDINPEIEAAVRQTLEYCQTRGIPIGVVCNGHQIIAFIGSRQDGVPPLKGRAITFASLEEMRARFKDFWNALSYPGVDNYVLLALLKTQTIPPPEKFSQRLGSDYPGFKMRNPMQNELQILGGLFLEDITRSPELEEEFQKECYCPSGALSQYALISRQILEARYSILFQQEIKIPAVSVSTKHGISKELTDDILSASLSRRPIILLGDVGVGKSMFICHFISLEAKEILKKALVIYIDFGKDPALPEELSNFVLEACKIQLLEKYDTDVEERNFVRGVYDLELKRFSKGIYADIKESNKDLFLAKEVEFLDSKLRDRAGHMKACFDHIARGQSRQIVIFLDNVDQRPLEFQDQVFLIGHGLAENWPGTVFISLRPDTFFYSKSKGSLTGYQPRVFTIAPPRVDIVISKRLTFAQKQLSDTGRLNVFPKGLSLDSKTLSEYINVILDSFDSNPDLVEFIDNLSGGNVRLAIDFLTAFTGSGHVDTVKILDKYQKTGRYIIPIHEFMRAVVYGDHEYFNPAMSPIANIFDISTHDSREHFLLAILLAHIERLSGMGDKQGFVAVADIFELGQSLGFQPLQIQFALGRALQKLLVESNPKFCDPASILSYRITTVGAYTASRMAFDFQYIDAMAVDTPIVDDAIKKQMFDARSLNERVRRAEVLTGYLDSQWKLLKGKGLAFDWEGGNRRIWATIEYLKSKQTSS